MAMETMMSPTQYLDEVLEGDESGEELYTDDEEEGEITRQKAILSWLHTFPQVKCVVKDNEINRYQSTWYENNEISKALLSAASEICGSQHDGTWASIANAVGCSNQSKGKDARLLAFNALLCHAVSDDCNERTTYVSRIIHLEKGVQGVLMQIIKEGEEMVKPQTFKSPHPDESYLDDLNIDEDNDSLLDDYELETNKENLRNTPLSLSTSRTRRTPLSIKSPKSSYRSPMATSGNGSGSRHRFGIFSAGSFGRRLTPKSVSPRESKAKINQLEKEAVHLKDANEALCGELNTFRHHESELRAKLEETEAKNRSIQLNIESESIANINKLRDECDAKVAALENKLKKSEKMLDNAARVEEELAILKDEVDVLHSSESKLKLTEDQLRKSKAKLEQMGDLSEVLASEEKAHAEVVAKCLELEDEIAVLAPLKRQLEDYKTRATNAEFKVVEYEDEIKKLKENGNHMKDQNNELQHGSLRQQAENDDLRKIMEQDNKSSLQQVNGGLGEGISELNPALKEELLRLRSENKRLKEFASKREDDAVQIMEEQVDDANRLSAKFKEQYLTTKTSLENKTRLLDLSKQKESQLVKEINQLNNQILDLTNTIDEERTKAKLEREDSIKILSETKARLLDEYSANINVNTTEWKTKLDKIQNEWEIKYEDMTTQSVTKEKELDQQICGLQDELREKIQNLEEEHQHLLHQMQKEHQEHMNKFESDKESEINDLITKGKEMIHKLKVDSESKIEMLKDEVFNAESIQRNILEQQKEYEQKVANKLSTYKQKLQLSQSEMKEVSKECEDLQGKIKKVEREKIAFQDENDRFRRQMNGRMGYDQGQYEELQREYNALLEENKALKSASNDELFQDRNHGLLDIRDNMAYTGTCSYNTSSFSQLRAEYEEKIEGLHDEKRQLVMKNSSLITDEKRAMNRAWDLEVQLKDTQEKNTSLQLQVERFERNRGTGPKKRLASKLSPRPMTKASETWRLSKMAKSYSSPMTKLKIVSSPTGSTTASIDMKSPDFEANMNKFRTKLITKLSSSKKSRRESTNLISDPSKSLDNGWEFH